MMIEDTRQGTVFPDWIESGIVGEEEFARAYHSLSDRDRSWLKKNLADLHLFLGRSGAGLRTGSASWRNGLESRERREVVSWAVLFLAEEFSSPVRVQAALMPALLAGVRDAAVIRISESGRPWPAPLLAGLELAGQETVLDMDKDQARALVDELTESSLPGAVLGLGEGSRIAENLPRRVVEWSCLSEPRIGVFSDNESHFDLPGLALAHPGGPVELWGGEYGPKPRGFVRRKGGLEEFLAQDFDAAFMPSALIEQGLSRFPLTLGPGHEGGWIWPDLSPDFFYRNNIAWCKSELD